MRIALPPIARYILDDESQTILIKSPQPLWLSETKTLEKLPPEILAKAEAVIADEFGEILDTQRRGDC